MSDDPRRSHYQQVWRGKNEQLKASVRHRLFLLANVHIDRGEVTDALVWLGYLEESEPPAVLMNRIRHIKTWIEDGDYEAAGLEAQLARKNANKLVTEGE